MPQRVLRRTLHHMLQRRKFPRVALLVAVIAVIATAALVAYGPGESASAVARSPQGFPSVMLPENMVTRVSDHVYAIIGFPNIGIVVGDRATLVVDTGMGPRNGAIALHEAQKLSKGPALYLTTTHFHPEHAAGEGAFPPNTILVRPIVQQKELEKDGMRMVGMFGRSEQNKALLAGVTFRAPDITFNKEITLDLGGATARLFWMGPAHTQGDELIDVQPDSTLIPGDIVQSKMVPSLPADNASVKNWIAILAQLRQNKPRFVLPDHGDLGDGSLVETEYQFLSQLQTRALELKRQGKSADEDGAVLIAEFKVKYPDWPNLNGIMNVVKHVYGENP